MTSRAQHGAAMASAIRDPGAALGAEVSGVDVSKPLP